MKTKNIKTAKRERRHVKIRTRVFGTKEKPRLSVFKSNTHIYAQLVDDISGKTIVSAHSLDRKGTKKRTEESFTVGESIAKKATEKGVTKVVFDRGGFKFTGRIAELARGAREGGLIF